MLLDAWAEEPELYLWYAARAAENRWSVRQLQGQIALGLHERQGAAVINFAAAVPSPSAALANPIRRAASAYRASAPGTENRVMAGSSIAFDSPCGTWKCAPIGRDIPCTSATELLENASPASVAPSIIASRASALRGSV